MKIEIRARNFEVTDEMRDAIGKRFRRVGNQAKEPAELRIELREERNPRIKDKMVAEATLWLKGGTLHAEEASPEMLHSIHELAEDIRRQVKRMREKERKRHQTRRMAEKLRGRSAPGRAQSSA